MEFKGSAGKWSLNCVGKSDLVIFSRRRKGYRKVCNITKEFHEDSYNARLIASAPEMLDMLNRISGEMLRSDFVLDEKWYIKIKELIKKATEI